MFGRVDLCDVVLEHLTISRFHTGELSPIRPTSIVATKFVFMLGTRAGRSRYLTFCMESDLKSIKKARMREEMKDMEASLLRAKLEASLGARISWGMSEDAIEEIEDDVGEISWQNYNGQLTERQEKTRDEVIKRLEKIDNMKKEIDIIRIKDISQGGLTQGQQTQIARNEQRMSQCSIKLSSFRKNCLLFSQTWTGYSTC